MLTLVTGVAEGTTGQTLINTAEVRPGAGQVDVEPANDLASASVSVAAPASDLGVSKTVDQPVVDEGDALTYTVVVENLGPSDAPTVLVQEALPIGLTLTQATPDQGTFDAQSGVWTLSLAPGASATLTVLAQADPTTVSRVACVSETRCLNL